MKIVKKECNCWIGIKNDYHQNPENYLYLDTYIEKLGEVSKETFKIAKMEASIKLEKIGISFKTFRPMDYINRRKGLSVLFDYCPNWGKRINWKSLRIRLMEEE